MKLAIEWLSIAASLLMLIAGCQATPSAAKPAHATTTVAAVDKVNDDVNHAFSMLLPVPKAMKKINDEVQGATPASLPTVKAAVAVDVRGVSDSVNAAQVSLGKTGAGADIAAASKAAAADVKRETADAGTIAKLKTSDPAKASLTMWALIAFGIATALLVGSFFVSAKIGTYLRTGSMALAFGGAIFYTLAELLGLIKWGLFIGCVIAGGVYVFRHWSYWFPAKAAVAPNATTPAPTASTPAKPSFLSALISPFKPVLGEPMTHQG